MDNGHSAADTRYEGESTEWGTMVLRVWTEIDHEDTFRARLTYSRTTTEPPHVVTVTSREQILDTVQEWLQGTQ